MSPTRNLRSSLKTPEDTVHRLQGLRAELEQKLLRNADYRALLAIERAISELSSTVPGPTALSPSDLRSPTPPPSPARHPKRLLQTDVAAEILRERGRPLPLEVLLGLLKEKGISFRGRRPELSLSATLSSHKDFRSIRYDGVRCWWFSGRPIPPGKSSATGKSANILAGHD
jgi:hypothetical protein